MMSNRVILRILPIFVLILGIYVSFYPMFLSGMDLVPGDIGDGRLNNYFLEHSWQWLSGSSIHSSFWNAPFFYPTENVMAYSDVLLGVAPIYWFFRFIGFDYLQSYQFWAVLIFISNYVAMYLLLRKGLKYGIVSAVIGSFLFAFCAPRVFKLGHIQLTAQFYTPICIYFILQIFQKRKNIPLFLIIAGAAYSLQLYSSFYLGWFLTFGGTIFLIIGLSIKESRLVLIEFIKDNKKWIGISLVLTLASLIPMLYHYLKVFAEFGGHNFGNVYLMLPRLDTWLSTPNFIYSWLAVKDIPVSQEHFMGIGFISLSISIWGILRLRKSNVWGKILAITLLIIFILSLAVMNGIIWEQIFNIYPGASAVRAVSRIFFIVLVGFSIGVAFAVSHLRVIWQIILLLAIIVEQIGPGYFHISRIDEAAKLEPLVKVLALTDKPFYFIDLRKDAYNPETFLDAMIAGTLTNRATLNGYSGNAPKGYQYLNAESVNKGLFSPSYIDYYRKRNIMDFALISTLDHKDFKLQEFNISDLKVGWNTLSNLFCNGCQKNKDFITLEPGGILFGPYISLSRGTYEVEYTGFGLDNATFDCTSEDGTRNHLLQSKSSNATTTKYIVVLDKVESGIEFRVFNNSLKQINISGFEFRAQQ